MAEQANGFLLKILSGVQFGVEVALDEGTYSFGSGDEADIRFADITLLPLHGRIRIRGGKLDLCSVGGDIATSSGLAVGPSDSDWHEIAQLDVIEAGTTRFAVGGRGAKWSTLAAAAPMPGAQAPAGAATRGGGLAVGVLGIGIVAMLSAAGFYYAGRESRILGVSPEVRLSPLDLVRNAVDALPFDHQLNVTEAVDGTIDVTGYVQTAVERRAATNALAETAVQVRRRIWVRDAIENEVAELIRSQDVPMEYRLSPRGVLTLSGTVLDPAVETRVIGLISDEVFGIASVDDEVRTADDIFADAEGVLREVRLSDRVILRRDGLLVEATGVVTSDRIDNWVGFIQVYARRWADLLPLRSYVTLENAPSGPTEPIVIGAAEGGRPIDAESLAPGSVPQALDLFAVPVDAGTDAPDPPVTDPRPVLQAAIDQLREEQPELYQALVQALNGDDVPVVLLQQAVAALGGQIVARPGANGIEPAVQLPGLDAPITLDEARAAIAALEPPAPTPDTPPTPAAAGTGGTPQPVATLLETVLRNATAPEAPVDAGTAPVASTDAIPAPEAPLPAEPEVTAIAAEPDTSAPRLVIDPPLPTTRATAETDASPGPALASGYERHFAADGLSGSVRRLISTAEALAGLEGGATNGASLVLDPADGGMTMLELARLQSERVASGETLIQMPRPLSARPVLQDRPTTCWDGSRLRIEAVPAVLLWLDLLSLHSDLDIGTLDAEIQPMLMEAALSPERLDACLDAVGTSYAQRLRQVSAFLDESRRNAEFSGFLFRNVAPFVIDVAGVNLTADRYVQTLDGRKLRVGAAPDLASRLSAIGDRGALFRVEDGWRVFLYPDTIAWRIADETLIR